MIRQNSADIRYFFSEPSCDITGVAIGSAGCRIASRLQRMQTGIDRFLFISCDKEDLALASKESSLYIPMGFQGKKSPSHVRGAALEKLTEIGKMLGKTKVIIVIAGLGGSVGSGLAPLITKLAKEQGALVICVAVMPCSYESDKHFYSATSLRYLRQSAQAVILVDNDELLAEVSSMPILDAHEMINEMIADALGRILRSPLKGEFHLGINKLATAVVEHGMSILGVGRCSTGNPPEEAVSNATRMIYRVADPRKAENAVLFLVGSPKITVGDIEASVRQLRAIVGTGGLKVEHGFSTNGHGNLTAVVLASGFEETKFSKYDPIDEILGERRIDDVPDCTINPESLDISRMD